MPLPGEIADAQSTTGLAWPMEDASVQQAREYFTQLALNRLGQAHDSFRTRAALWQDTHNAVEGFRRIASRSGALWLLWNHESEIIAEQGVVRPFRRDESSPFQAMTRLVTFIRQMDTFTGVAEYGPCQATEDVALYKAAQANRLKLTNRGIVC